MSTLALSPGRPLRGDRAAEAMLAVKGDLRSLQEATANRFASRVEKEEEHISVAAGLLSKAEKMTELDMQESYQAVFTSLESKLGRFVDLVNHLEHDLKDNQRDCSKASTVLKNHIDKLESRQQDTSANLSRITAKLSHVEDRANHSEGGVEGAMLQISHLKKDLELAQGHSETSVQVLEKRVSELAARLNEDETEAKVLGKRVELLEKKCENISSLEEKVEALEKYNRDFMALSKESSGTFETEIDQKLAALDTRYASLLKHYHSTIMGQVGNVQETFQSKFRTLQASTEADITKIADEASSMSASFKTAHDKLAGEVKTLNRRLLSSLRLMKDSGFDAQNASPSAFTTPVPSVRSHSVANNPPAQHAAPISNVSATAEIDHFLRGLEQMSL
eukprot:TRINITY_DN7568_c0_g2_i1.p1 TRINITY_DN7568_c0_g2~~TRINITY_DN7568_c0_g2_i1.p1  ORF type:complete len:393 (+),score=70.20 TRINITY_DN7568_c0_g2_i1:55-1233(+)